MNKSKEVSVMERVRDGGGLITLHSNFVRSDFPEMRAEIEQKNFPLKHPPKGRAAVRAATRFESSRSFVMMETDFRFDRPPIM